MSEEEFKPIETQEQLMAVLKDRIERAESSATKKAEQKYADYDSIKAQNAELQEKLEKANALAHETEDKIKELEKANAGYKLSKLKVKVAQEAGLPYELADKLAGADEDAIKADAAEMAKYIKPQQVAPLGAAEPRTESKDPFTAGLQSMAKGLLIDE